MASCRSSTPRSSVTASDVAAALSRRCGGKLAARTAIHQAAAASAHAARTAAPIRRGQRSRGPRATAHARRASCAAEPEPERGDVASGARTYRALISIVLAAVWLTTSGSYISSATVGGSANVPTAVALIMNS